MNDFFSDNNIKEFQVNRPTVDYSKKSGGSYKYGKKEDWLFGTEKEQFLTDPEWNNLEINKDIPGDLIDRNQSNFDRLKKMLTVQEYQSVVNAYALFIKNCIPKPFKSVSYGNTNRGWTLSCLASTFGEGSISTMSAGKHVVANVSKIDNELFFTIYAKREKLENIYGENFEKLADKYKGIKFYSVETIKGRKLDVYGIDFPIESFIKEIDDHNLILVIRDFTTHLINASKTIWVKHQSQNLVNDILERIKNEYEKI